jgi:hypothetical protein
MYDPHGSQSFHHQSLGYRFHLHRDHSFSSSLHLRESHALQSQHQLALDSSALRGKDTVTVIIGYLLLANNHGMKSNPLEGVTELGAPKISHKEKQR